MERIGLSSNWVIQTALISLVLLGFITCEASEDDCPPDDNGGGLSVPESLTSEDGANSEDEEDSAELEDISEEEEFLEEPDDELDGKEDELPSEEREPIVDWHPDRTETSNTAVISNCSFFKIPLRVAKCFIFRAFLTILYNIPAIRSTSISSYFPLYTACFRLSLKFILPHQKEYVTMGKNRTGGRWRAMECGFI